MEKTELDSDWDTFVRSSPNGSIFSLSDYLNAVDARHELWYCYKNRERRAAVALIESPDGGSTVLHDFVIYGGVMFPPPAHRQNRAQIISEQHRLAEFIARDLAKRYENVALSLDPSVVDIRAFLWHNYGTEKPRYVPDVRYTSYVSLDGLATADDPSDALLFHQCAKARRQEIRYAIRDGVYTREESMPSVFVDFYDMTMGRQGIGVEKTKLEGMHRLIVALTDARLGRMFVTYTADGRPGSMAFWGIDDKRAYFIFGANDPELRDNHTGSAVLWDSFRELNRSGVREVDLEGVNSPRRGWFKLSFGGDLRPYFHLFLERKL